MEADRRKLIRRLMGVVERAPQNAADEVAVLFAGWLLKYLTNPTGYEKLVRPTIGEQEHAYVVQAAWELESDFQRQRILPQLRREQAWTSESPND